MKKYLAVSFFLFCFTLVEGQVDTTNRLKNALFATYQYRGDSIVVRFAPDNSLFWQASNKKGYKISRIEIGPEGEFIGKEKLINDSLKPWKIEEWQKRIPVDNKFAPIALQAIHGKNFIMNEGDASLMKVRQLVAERDMRYSFALSSADFSAITAQASGLRFVDSNIEKNKTYIYTIKSNVDNAFIANSPVSILVRTTKETEKIRLKGLTLEAGEKTIKLSWNLGSFGNSFSGFYIERSRDGNVFSRINNAPQVKLTNPNEISAPGEEMMSYIDTLKENYSYFYYRLVGITPFGEEVVSEEIQKACGIDKTAPMQVSDLKAEILKNGSVKLSWKNPALSGDLKGHIIARNTNPEETYDPITPDFIPYTQNEFIDKKPNTRKVNYYRIFTFDTSGNFASSIYVDVMLPDSIPPLVPSGIKANVDTSGIVKITWKAGTDEDIMGYRMYFANKSSHEFTCLSPQPFADTIFIDTLDLKSLTKKIFYELRAVDESFNHSLPTRIEVKRPDKIKPTKPVFRNYELTDTTVTIYWNRSTSNDLKEEKLYIVGPDGKNSEKYTLPAGDTLGSFIEKGLVPDRYYTYTLIAIDSSGLKSEKAFPLILKSKKKLDKPEVNNLTGVYNPDKKTVELKWTAKGEIKNFTILKGSATNKLATYNSTNETFFTDTYTSKPGLYKYAVRAVSRAGVASDLSNEIEIVIP